MDAVDEGAHLASVNKEGLSTAVAEFAVSLVSGYKPKTNRNLCGVEELTREGDHAVDQIRFDDVSADLSLTGGVGGHGAVGHDEACNPVRRKVKDEVLNPGIVSA